MADLHSRIRTELDRRLAIARQATPGPWELGDHWRRAGVMPKLFGADRCAFCETYGAPVAVDPHMDVNGRTMLGHVHRDLAPYNPTRSVSSADHTTVIIGYSDGGPNIGEDDAAFVTLHDPSDAFLRYTRDLAVLERHRPVVLRGGPGAKYYDTTTVCATCSPPQFAEDAWPCPDIHDLAESLGIPTTPKGDAGG